MIKNRLFVLCAIVVLLVTASPVHAVSHRVDDRATSFGCGIERWSIKTGTDVDAGKINLATTTWTSPHRLTILAKPSSLPATHRISPVETTVYRMTVNLLAFKEETDSDIHLRVAGFNGVQMIAEIPSPGCVESNSPFYSRIATARAVFILRYGQPSGSWITVNRSINLTGVGFFDFLHGASGQALNGVELHPILSVSP